MGLIKKAKKEMSEDMPMKGKGMSLPIALNVQRQAKKKKMAQGGAVSKGHEVAAVGGPGREMSKLRKDPDPILMAEGGMAEEPTSSSGRTLAEEIMAKKRMKKMEFSDEEGMSMDKGEDMDAIKKENYADGGMVDLDEESEEQPNDYYKLNRMAADEEQYDDGQISKQPLESKGHSPMDELDRSMVAAIRRKMSAKRGM